MRISGGAIGILLAFIGLAGGGAMNVAPQHTEIGWGLIAFSVGGGVTLAVHHIRPRRDRDMALVGIFISTVTLVVCLVWYFRGSFEVIGPIEAPSSNPAVTQTKEVLPVIAIDCRPASLPTVVPPTGLNYIDFRYPSSAIGVGQAGPPGSPTAWPSERITMPLYCEFTIHENMELYDVSFNLHVTFHQVAKLPGGQIQSGTFVGEREWPIAIGRINNSWLFGFYAFTTSDYMVYVNFPDLAKYLSGQSNDPKEVRLLTINWKALSFAPASAFTPNK
jgi:hypothetical protein